MTEAASPSGSRWDIRRWLRFAIQVAAGLALFGLLLALSDCSSLGRLAHLRVLPLAAAFACTAAIAASVGLRWGSLVNALVGRPTAGWLHFSQYFLWSRVLGFVVPKDLSDLAGRTAVVAARHDIPLRHAVASVLLDRGFDLLTVVLFLGPSLLFLGGAVEASTAVALMAVLASGFCIALRLAHRHMLALAMQLYDLISQLTYRLPLLRRRPLGRVESLDLSLEALTRAFLFSLSKFLFTVLRLIFFAVALDMPVSPFVFLLGAPVGQLGFLFAFTPGGLGIFELSWYGALAQAGVSEVYISPFLVEQRVFTTLFVGVLALLSSRPSVVLSRD